MTTEEKIREYLSQPHPEWRPPTFEDKDDALAYYTGHLIAAWSGCENMFLSMHRCLYTEADQEMAIATWFACPSTSGRIALLEKLLSAKAASMKIREEVARHRKSFEPISQIRNYFCHAHWIGDLDGGVTLHGFKFKGADAVITVKQADDETIDELRTASRAAVQLNRAMWPTFLDLRASVGALHIPLH